jgi:hypothetical protein
MVVIYRSAHKSESDGLLKSRRFFYFCFESLPQFVNYKQKTNKMSSVKAHLGKALQAWFFLIVDSDGE